MSVNKDKIINKNRIVKKRLYKKTNSRAGAKSKFQKINKEIIERTRQGASIKDRYYGLIHSSTFYEWYNTGLVDLQNNLLTEYSEFSRLLNKAEQEYRDTLRKLIESHTINDWKAASWLLERSDPENYSLKQKMEVKQEIEISQKALLELPDNGDR